jgi:two-component system, cell cycle sensor histidine kinase and response regulator CckA
MTNRQILVVEDENIIAMDVEHRLKSMGYTVPALASSGEEAVKKVAEIRPDLVLMDIRLKGDLDGVGAAEQIRARYDVPVVYLTAYMDDYTLHRAKKTEPGGYILKPVENRELYASIELALYKHEIEGKLRKTERWLATTLRSIGDAVIATGEKGLITFMNPVAEALTGWGQQEALGNEWAEVFQAVNAETRRPGLEPPTLLVAKDGTEMPIEASASPIQDGSGCVTGVVFVFRDVSRRQRAERQIERLANFPRLSPNPVLELTADGTPAYFNRAAEELAHSLTKDHPNAIMPPDTGKIVKECLATGGSKLRHQTTVAGRTLSWSFFPILADQVVHCYAWDITERLNLEAQLLHAQKMESVGQLAAGVAHEFNNLLTIIQGYASLLLSRQDLGPALSEPLIKITTAAERAGSLTRQLMTFSRKQPIQPKKLDLNGVIGNLTTLLCRLLGEDIALQLDCAPNLPPVWADAGMVEQILLNLALNARDAMVGGGELVITTTTAEVDDAYSQCHPGARAGLFVCVSVTDTGCGMDSAILSRIFEPFFTTKEVGKGTGLGLAVVYGLVNQHRGWVEATSEVARGSTFKVFFPASPEAGELPVGRVAEPEERGGNETVLLVEDEAGLRGLVRQILQDHGYRVLEAGSGLEALRLWEQHAKGIDLLLTDLSMPGGVSGQRLAEKLQAQKPGLEVIYSSGGSLGQDLSARKGISFLQKPYDVRTLTQAVRDCLDGCAPRG